MLTTLQGATHMQKHSSNCFIHCSFPFASHARDFSQVPSECKTIHAITCRSKSSMAISKRSCLYLWTPKFRLQAIAFTTNLPYWLWVYTRINREKKRWHTESKLSHLDRYFSAVMVLASWPNFSTKHTSYLKGMHYETWNLPCHCNAVNAE